MDKPWIRREVKVSMRARNRLYKHFKRTTLLKHEICTQKIIPKKSGNYSWTYHRGKKYLKLQRKFMEKKKWA